MSKGAREITRSQTPAMALKPSIEN